MLKSLTLHSLFGGYWQTSFLIMAEYNWHSRIVSSLYGIPGIYAEEYIVFIFLFIRLFVHTSVSFLELTTSFWLKVSLAVYISVTT